NDTRFVPWRGQNHEAAGICQTSSWDRCRVAACRAGAARYTAATTHRATRCGRDGLEFVDGCFCHPPARTRLDRGRYYRCRVSLGRGKLLIVTYGAAAAAVKQATTTIPIVLAVASDPGGGLIASLARRDGNVTGISIQQSELIGKRLALLREAVPHLRRLVIVANAGYAMPVLEAQEAKATAQAPGLEAARPEIWRSEDITPAFEAIRGKADALYVISDPLIAANRTLVTTLALSARLPTMLSYGDYVAAGGLMSYGPNFANLFRRAADMVDKILRGTKPG